MRTFTVIAATLVLAAGIAAGPAQALAGPVVVKFPDGITARLTFPGSLGDVVLQADPDGNIPVAITIYASLDGTWQQVAQGATLRVFSVGLDPVAPEADLVSTYFTSSATAATTVAFPASALTGPGFYDVFVTFNIPTYATSHHSLLKNALLDQNLFNTADYFDYNLPTRLVGLGA